MGAGPRPTNDLNEGYAIYFPHGTDVFRTPELYWNREVRRVENPLHATIFATAEEAQKKAELEWGPHETRIVKITATVEIEEVNDR